MNLEEILANFQIIKLVVNPDCGKIFTSRTNIEGRKVTFCSWKVRFGLRFGPDSAKKSQSSSSVFYYFKMYLKSRFPKENEIKKCVPLVIFNLDDDHVDRKSTAEKCARAAYYVVCSCQSLLHPLLKLLHLQCCSAKIIKSLWHISQHVPTALLDTREREREHSDKIPSFWHRADSQVSEFKVMDRSKQIGNVRRARSREIAQNKLSYSASRHHLRLWRFINDDGLLNG